MYIMVQTFKGHKHGIDANDRFNKKETEYHGAFADLSKRGTMHIMDYTERGGSGKILGTRKSNKSSKK